MSTTKSEITINGHPVPERIWIDFRDEPANRYWRVCTAPNAFANVGYVRASATPADAEQLVRLREAAENALNPLEYLLRHDLIPADFVGPTEQVVTALRHALGPQKED